ncbi:hypothetical protein LEP1GSC193_1716 [Leptospira alstonii serovar Pingchang str. 80-412]|uniref:Uncharacterized protein n=2 Tax=Leptospira alstonii TaxID=28452 RepID=M6D653_9LEPT|nr:hypothetical protein LEP1GSC194_4330 [Leptospira alstonii serovar Sichuan str. 79601]EQA78652.1 hypothetical protein LEP1GSC193_1716 [Leptospira alstonii serovar Pingchang str. 80-412]
MILNRMKPAFNLKIGRIFSVLDLEKLQKVFTLTVIETPNITVERLRRIVF